MKTLTFTFVTVLLLCASAFGQNWVEVRTHVVDGVATARVDGLFTKAVSGNWGSFAWMQTQEGYSEAYAGATYSPRSWVQLALGAGLEQADNPFRIGSYVWLGHKKLSGLVILEGAGSGFWYKEEINYQLSSKFGIGTLSEQTRGHGVKFELNLPHTHFKLWAAPMYNHGDLGSIMGLRWNL